MTDTPNKQHRSVPNKYKKSFNKLSTSQGIQCILVTCDTGNESQCYKQMIHWLNDINIYANKPVTQSNAIMLDSNATTTSTSTVHV